MRPPAANKKKSGRRTTKLRAALLFGVVCALLLALFAFLRRASREAEWPLAPGTVQDSRIVSDHVVETERGSQVTWRADYKVIYFVATREYSLWTDSGIRGQSQDDVRLRVTQTRPSCRVRYNPRQPEVATGDCTDSDQ